MSEKTFTHYAHTANYWALGVSLDNAKRRLRDTAGSNTIREYGYQICEFSRPVTIKEIDVDQVDGTLRTADGISVEEVYTTPKARKHLDRTKNDPNYYAEADE